MKAAKYASVESSDSVHLINWHFKRHLSNQNFDPELIQRINIDSDNYTWDDELPLRDFIIDCYLNAALCSYVSTNFQEAVTYSGKAVEIGRENKYALEKMGLTWSRPVRLSFYLIIIFAIFWFKPMQDLQFFYFQF